MRENEGRQSTLGVELLRLPRLTRPAWAPIENFHEIGHVASECISKAHERTKRRGVVPRFEVADGGGACTGEPGQLPLGQFRGRP